MGIGVEVNHREAVKWFRKSAEQGNGDGQSCLGTAYNNGDGVAKDFEEALKWALLAQKNGKETEETIIWLKQMIDQEKASERKDRQLGAETVSCSFVDSEYNNGDTFLLKTDDGIVFDAHLYGVDAFETSNEFPSLVNEQAKYFGITNEEAIGLGNKARELVRTKLVKNPEAKTFGFTTPFFNFLKKESNNKSVLDGEIIVDGESLACLLVKNGLVKIYGTIPHTHPESIVSREKLLELEAEAKREKVGGWGLVKSPNVESATNPQQNP
jgi:endonuclease YncB( thermonuclease family)